MIDTKQTKSIGEHFVCSMLARHDWAPALTRDGLERTDIIAMRTRDRREVIQVQVKSIRGIGDRVSWPLGFKSQEPSVNDLEWFVLVSIDPNPLAAIRSFVVPRDHVAAAAWISHVNWLTEPGVPPGKRNVGVDRARVHLRTFSRYENRWDLLDRSTVGAPILLPPAYRAYALEERVGLPPGHPWHEALPDWGSDGADAAP